MDPLTQGVLGSTAAQLFAKPAQKVAALVLGFLSGMAADMDVLIRSSSDPLFSLEYHRHFTHALVFIPFGALLCAVAFYYVMRLFKKRLKQGSSVVELSFFTVYVFCFAGYATHALLDACTTYGTQLLWPFSDARIAWNNVSVIDPLFTIPLLFLLLLSVFKRSTLVACLATFYALGYLFLGVVQNQRAEKVAYQLAQSRGHTPINLGTKPSFANILVWKSVYEFDGHYYVDAIRVAGSAKVYQGSSTPKLDTSKHFAWLDTNSQQAKDIERFRWFSNDHLGIDPDNAYRIIDIRYSLIPNRFGGMWGITLDPNAKPSAHIKWTNSRPQGDELSNQTARLWSMILGTYK